MDDCFRIAIVDCHPLFRDGVACVLKSVPDLEIVAQGTTCVDATRIVSDISPDVLLLDICASGGAIGTTKAIVNLKSPTSVIMMSASGKEQYVSDALDAGARGFFLKNEGCQALVRALQAVCGGESYVTPCLAARMFQHMKQYKSGRAAGSELSSLTRRETEILHCVGHGLTNKEIASKLAISEKTVKHYMTNIMNKLQVSNRVQAALIVHKSTSKENAIHALG